MDGTRSRLRNPGMDLSCAMNARETKFVRCAMQRVRAAVCCPVAGAAGACFAVEQDNTVLIQRCITSRRLYQWLTLITCEARKGNKYV